MTAEQLTYWLQGFFELSGATALNEAQVKILKEHLGLVVKKVTPSTMPSNTITIYGGNGFEPAKPITNIPQPVYTPRVQVIPDVVKPPVEWTVTSTADNKVMDIKTELTC
jgi:hypothetical protein